MVADNERREVAYRLRNMSKYTNPDNVYDSLSQATGVNDVIDGDGSLVAYLADLIEPSEPEVKCVAEVKVDGERLEKLVHDAAVELTGIDRDALLELADEIEADDVTYGVSMQYVLVDYARRIRDALGVER